MNKTERQEQIKQLYAEACAHPANEQAAFLDEVCAEDESLRRELESLLGWQQQAKQFIETPALNVAAEMLAGQQAESKLKRIGAYEILSQIGAGGMGEVYLAEDARLKRRIAIKLLPAHFVADADRVRRFEMEARAASALNHPNILTVYEIGQSDGLHFIATEFIEGQTLRERLLRGRLNMAEALDIALQIANALAAAHAAGIVHRDIKPENVMLRPDGYVKVLDFGLAKLTEPAEPAKEIAEAAPTQDLTTQPGVVIGTVRYMSPEQARGLKVDARSDIFSFGVMLYEMLAGRVPFTGATTADVLAVILQTEPASLVQHNPEVPRDLERIIGKALRKERDERYQTIKDLIVDLREIKQEMDVQTRLNRTRSTEVQPFRPRVGLRTLAPLALALGLVLAVVAGVYLMNRGGGAIDSLAVLPFVNEGADPETEYLGDGLAETLINALAQLPNLKVRSRNAAFSFKGRQTDAQAIGKQLGVRAVLTGSIRQRGDALTVIVELVDVRDNSYLWGHQYRDRKLNDLLAMQEEMAQSISQNLRLTLTGEDRRLLAKHPTNNPEAYRLYLKGRYYANKLTKDGLEKGVESFRQAIAFDREYALAYSGLAYYFMQSLDLVLSPKEAMPRAKEAALKALSLDERSAETHFSLAMFYWQYEWDWAAAEREFKRALELDPNSADARGGYGFFLTLLGRTEEGIAQCRRYAELNRLQAEPDFYYLAVLGFARRADEAITLGQQVVKEDPNFWLSHVNLGRAYEQKGQLAEAVAEYEKARSIDDSIPEALGDLGRGYALMGSRDKAETLLAELRERAKRNYVAPYNFATIYIALGDKQQAFAWLEKAYEDRSWYLTWLKVVPIFDSLRDDSRFADLLRRVGL